jgi:putative transcriptional regulator
VRGRELGNRLAAARLGKGLTQAELAQRVRVSRKTINTIEKQVYVPSTLLSLRIARALGVAVEDLFHLADEAPPEPSEG